MRTREVGLTAAGCVGLLIVLAVFALIGGLIWTWILMLVAGAIGLHWHGHTPGFWTVFPVGMLLGLIISALTGNRSRA